MNAFTLSSVFRTFRFGLAPVLCAVLALHAPLFAAEAPDDKAPPDHIRVLLMLLVQQEEQLRAEIENIQQAPPTEQNEGRKKEVYERMDQIYVNFEAIATQRSTEDFFIEEGGETDWWKEVQELATPLLHSLRDLTKKPRKVDKLKRQIEILEEQLTRYEDATKNIDSILAVSKNTGSGEIGADKFLARMKMLRSKYSPDLVRFQLQEARRNLEREMGDRQTLFDGLRDGFAKFFRHRGINLVITVFMSALAGWVLFFIREYLIGKKCLFSISARLRKFLAVAYNGFVVLSCVVTGLVSLYLLNDWLLLSFMIVVLVGIGWTSRQLAPRFLKELQIALNLGTVRENERLIWNGVPWLVESIGISAKLTNEQLEEGTLLLPLKDLIDRHSRPVVAGEPWFPTSKNDWVMLSDQTCGQVVRQTQEQVVLEARKSGGLKYYPTASFLALAPLNLSSGFEYNIEFGLDYALQHRICDEIPHLFEQALKEHFADRLRGDSPDFKSLHVRFDNAGASALNLRVLVDVDGRCAKLYGELEGEIQKTLVSICNKHGFTIPFHQLTLNLPDNATNLCRSGPQVSSD